MSKIKKTRFLPQPSPDTGWRIRHAKNVYETNWFKVGEYKTIAPTGVDADYSIISFKNLAIGMLPIFEDGMTVLVGQHRFAIGQYSWEVPEGGGNMNQPPLETAKRELSEEVNLKAGHWLPLFSDLHLSNSITDERSFGFLAWGLSVCESHQMDDVEDLSTLRVPVGEAVKMVVNGQISDGLSLAILLKADHLWRTGQLPEEVSRAFEAGQI